MTSMPRAFATAISATLVVPQSTVTMTVRAGRDGRLDRGERQPVALVEPARDVRLDRDAEASQRDGHDREPGQPVGVEVAEDQDPLAAVARRAQPGQQRCRIGQRGRVVETVERVGEPGGDVLGGRRHRGRRGGPPCAPETPRPVAAATAARRRRDGLGKVQRKRGSTTSSGCHGGLHHGSTDPRAWPTSGRRAPDPRGCARGRGDRAGGRPRAASRRAAGSRRRSTSRSRRRSR